MPRGTSNLVSLLPLPARHPVRQREALLEDSGRYIKSSLATLSHRLVAEKPKDIMVEMICAWPGYRIVL